MKRSKFTPEQIANILKEFENGTEVQEITPKHGISSAAFYKWCQRYGGYDANELKRRKELEEEKCEA